MIEHPNIPESARRTLTRVAAHPHVEALRLFGSRRFGDHQPTSDVDVAVHGPELTPLEWARLRLSVDEADTLYAITLTHFDRNPPKLQHRILTTGELIYVSAQASGRLGQPREGVGEPRAGGHVAEGTGTGHRGHDPTL